MSDVHSFSRPDEISVRHLSLDLTVDFESHKLRGSATLDLERHAPASEVVLDTRDLTIRRVTLDDANEDVAFTLGEPDKFMGRSLTIPIGEDTKRIRVEYESSPEAAAVQWLSPEQTAGKKHPFLFTQSESILARSWVPCQDTPGVRMTYDATIRVPKDLLAVMSADNPTERSADGVYRFTMPQPIPSYLLALSVGDLGFRDLGGDCGVYAEQSVVDAAAWELADTPAMVEAAASIYGPYRWGRYDILVLPPSFPFGGMENPRLTFATPTILAGDRSLVALVAHELAHSWSGNLVTNATWNDFWLNEGFTVYFERRIMEKIRGRDYEEMLALLGMQDLEADVAELGADSPDTHLLLDLEGRDADDGMTKVAYEKGAFFLRLVEETVGREAFDRFLMDYFEQHAFQSMDTRGFVEWLKANLLDKHPGSEARIDLDAWIDGPGIPANAPRPRSDAFQKVEKELSRFESGTPAKELQTEGWSTHEWIHFVRHLPKATSLDRMAELDEAFGLSDTGNNEILCDWLMQAIQRGYEPAMPAVERFLTNQGRRKYLKPLYQALAATPEGLEKARAIYKKARPMYHSVSYGTIDGILGV